MSYLNVGRIEAEDKLYSGPNFGERERAAPVERSLVYLPPMVDVTTRVSSKAGVEAGKRALTLQLASEVRRPSDSRGRTSSRGARSRCGASAVPPRENTFLRCRGADAVLFYHSQQELAIVGLVEVTGEAYPIRQVPSPLFPKPTPSDSSEPGVGELLLKCGRERAGFQRRAPTTQCHRDTEALRRTTTRDAS